MTQTSHDVLGDRGWVEPAKPVFHEPAELCAGVWLLPDGQQTARTAGPTDVKIRIKPGYAQGQGTPVSHLKGSDERLSVSKVSNDIACCRECWCTVLIFLQSSDVKTCQRDFPVYSSWTGAGTSLRFSCVFNTTLYVFIQHSKARIADELPAKHWKTGRFRQQLQSWSPAYRPASGTYRPLA